MDQQEIQTQQKREVESRQESTIAARSFVPLTDIFEDDHALTIVMEMPGIQRDNVDVRVENNILTLEARLDYSKYQGLKPVYTEYNVGNYTRSFELSGKINQDAIRAELTDGVMTLTLPKAESAKPRRIPIS
ncbi:MAG: Hsp20/alpha crystallin family protein [Rhizobiales bacterium]|nr:Hsp20/alpha crystallin family protein [Hyphomicrobiales bacterium]